MKILQIVHAFPPSSNAGAEKYTYVLSCELAKRHNVHVMYPMNNVKYLEFRSLLDADQLFTRHEFGINKRSMPWLTALNTYMHMAMTIQNPEMNAAFKQFLKRLKPDVIHFQHLLYMSASLVNVAYDLGIPTVFTLHDYWFSCPTVNLFHSSGVVCAGPEGKKCCQCWSESRVRMNKYLPRGQVITSMMQKAFELANPPTKFGERSDTMLDLFRKIARIVAPSRFLREWFIKLGMPPEKIVHLENGYDVKGLNFSGEKVGGEKLIFGFMGRMLPIKGVHVLLEAFLGIPEGHAELRLYGGYNADDTYIRELIDRIGSRQDIKLMGFTNNIGNAYHELDVIVFPSLWYENCPLTLAEARILEIPVIASDIGAIPEFVEENVNGLLFRSGDPDELRVKMSHLIANPYIIRRFRFSDSPNVPSIQEHTHLLEGIYLGLTTASSSAG